MIEIQAPRAHGRSLLLAGAMIVCLAPGAAPVGPGVTRTRLPDHRLGPLETGKTTERSAVQRLGEGLKYPLPWGTGRCWSEEHLMLCAAFAQGKLYAVSLQREGSLPAPATRFLRGPDGKKRLPSPSGLQAKMKPSLFLDRIVTETGLGTDSTERDVLAALGSPHELVGTKPPFRFIYRSTREKDPACAGRCMATYTLNRGRLISIYLRAE